MRAKNLSILGKFGIPVSHSVAFLGGKESFVLSQDFSKGGRRFSADAYTISFSELEKKCDNSERLVAGIMRDLAIMHCNGILISPERAILEPWLFYKKSDKSKHLYRAVVDPGCILRRGISPALKLQNLSDALRFFSGQASPKQVNYWIKVYRSIYTGSDILDEIVKYYNLLGKRRRKKE